MCKRIAITQPRTNYARIERQRKGATMAMLAVLMPVMIGIAAFAINIVHMEMTRTELQISLDLASRAAGRTLAVTEDQQQAIAAAELILQQNPYANQILTLAEMNIEFGVSTRMSESDRYDFVPGVNPNAVKIESNGTNVVPTLFPTMGVALQHRPIRAAICTKVELDISLVLDRSGSMAFASSEASGGGVPSSAPPGWSFGQPAPPNSRWLDAVAAVNGFLNVMENSIHDEHVTLTTYASTATTDVQLTNNYQSIRNSLNARSAQFNGGGTGIGNAITKGVAALNQNGYARPWAIRVLVIMSDGMQTTGTNQLLAAQQAAEDYVMIYTVTFSDEADATSMQQVAAAAAGKHYHAVDSYQLNHVFEDIARGLPTLITF